MAKKAGRIACRGAETRRLDQLVEFQGDLKGLSLENAAKLRREACDALEIRIVRGVPKGGCTLKPKRGIGRVSGRYIWVTTYGRNEQTEQLCTATYEVLACTV